MDTLLSLVLVVIDVGRGLSFIKRRIDIWVAVALSSTDFVAGWSATAVDALVNNCLVGGRQPAIVLRLGRQRPTAIHQRLLILVLSIGAILIFSGLLIDHLRVLEATVR